MYKMAAIFMVTLKRPIAAVYLSSSDYNPEGRLYTAVHMHLINTFYRILLK